MIYSILYIIQISWYKHIFINQLQQYRNKIVVQLSSYYGHIYGYLCCGEAADHMITKDNALLCPFFFSTYMVLFDTFLFLCMFICISVAHSETKYVKTLINRA